MDKYNVKSEEKDNLTGEKFDFLKGAIYLFALTGLSCLTSFHHDQIDVSVQNHCACQVQLVGVGLHFKLLGRILQVTDPVQGRQYIWIRQTSILQHKLHNVLKTVFGLLRQMRTCTLQCEHRQWGLLLTSWPSSLSSALMWAFGLRWHPREPCKEEENIRKPPRKGTVLITQCYNGFLGKWGESEAVWR